MAKRTKVVASVPRPRRDTVNAVFEKQGYGPDTFSIPLWNGPETQILRYGCSWPMTDVELSIANGILTVPGDDLEENVHIDDHASGQNPPTHRKRD